MITEPQKLFLAFKCWLANQVQVQVRVTRLTSWPRVDSSIPKTPSDCWQTHEKKIHVHTILTHSTILVMWNASACVLKRPCNGYNGATTQQRDNDEATKQRSNERKHSFIHQRFQNFNFCFLRFLRFLRFFHFCSNLPVTTSCRLVFPPSTVSSIDLFLESAAWSLRRHHAVFNNAVIISANRNVCILEIATDSEAASSSNTT
mgnify:CR=1 FL=1